VAVDDLALDGFFLGDLGAASGPDGLDLLWIQGQDLSLGFTLAGTATLSWSGAAPTQSRLAFQIKVARQNVVGNEKSSWGDLKDLYRKTAR
jgi:hypothetical protein